MVVVLLLVSVLAAGMAHAAPCPGPALQVLPLGAGRWWVPAYAGDSNAANRGQVSNTVLVLDEAVRPARLWALGSGPSPVWGRALACVVQRQLGRPVTDVVSPWARPELVLGVAGLMQGGPLRHWGHAAVAEAMAVQCPHCVDRLRLRLRQPAPVPALGTDPLVPQAHRDPPVDRDSDLAGDPIRLPTLLLQGEQGRLGPFDWWRLPRSTGRWVTVWRLAQPGQAVLWVAHGLLNGSGPPDGRDAELSLLHAATQQLVALAAADGDSARFLGEQGGPMPADAPARHAAYWQVLLQTATAAVLRGDDETAPAPGWPGLPEGWVRHPWHHFNWQRAWRQMEAQVLAVPPLLAAPAAAAASQ